jgi:hypothetical protein
MMAHRVLLMLLHNARCNNPLEDPGGWSLNPYKVDAKSTTIRGSEVITTKATRLRKKLRKEAPEVIKSQTFTSTYHCGQSNRCSKCNNNSFTPEFHQRYKTNGEI